MGKMDSNEIIARGLNEIINGPDNVYICAFLDGNILEALKERISNKTDEEIDNLGTVFININTYNITEDGKDSGWITGNYFPASRKNPHAILFNNLNIAGNWTEEADTFEDGVPGPQQAQEIKETEKQVTFLQ